MTSKSHGSSSFIHQVEPYVTENEKKAVSAYLESGGWLTEHEKTREFEKLIAKFVGTKYAVAVPSGTTALYLSLLATGIGPGDAVVVPDYTMIATPNSVKWAGAYVYLADITRETMCLDLSKVRISENTRAVMYVSINGRSGNMDELVEFCNSKGLTLIEDAAQSLGSKWRGKHLGTFGEAGIYSFTPHKIITTGQGGAVVTNNEEIYERVVGLKDFCRIAPGVDIHKSIGFNFKFTDIQAVIGIEQLKMIDFRMERRRSIYKWYREELEGYVDFLETDLTETVPWFVDVLLDVPRDQVISSLKDFGIGSRPFYPPIHTQTPYLMPDYDFEVACSICPRGLWLPSSIGLSQSKVAYVSRSLKDVISKLRGGRIESHVKRSMEEHHIRKK